VAPRRPNGDPPVDGGLVKRPLGRRRIGQVAPVGRRRPMFGPLGSWGADPGFGGQGPVRYLWSPCLGQPGSTRVPGRDIGRVRWLSSSSAW